MASSTAGESNLTIFNISRDQILRVQRIAESLFKVAIHVVLHSSRSTLLDNSELGLLSSSTYLLENSENASTFTRASIIKNSNVTDCTISEHIIKECHNESNCIEEMERQKCYNSLEYSTEDIVDVPAAILQFESKNGSKSSQDNIKKAKV